MDQAALDAAVVDFCALIDALYGVYLDGCIGFKCVVDQIVRSQAVGLEHLKASNPQLATIEYLDSVGYACGTGPPSDPATVVQHITTQGEAKARNATGGRNQVFLASMCLVMLYQLWEEHFRKRIADALSIEKNEVKVPLFGDLRLIRVSVVHNLGFAVSEIAECEVLRWFKPGDSIAVTNQQMESVIRMSYEFVDGLPAAKVPHPPASSYLRGQG